MGYAFISYSTKNQTSADSIKRMLNDNNIQTWMAPGDIPPGCEYAGVINQAIKECSCFLLVLSDEAQNSKWVPKEIERAINYGKTVVPVQVKSVILNDAFELYIGSNQVIPIEKIDASSQNVGKLLDRVKYLVSIDDNNESKTCCTKNNTDKNDYTFWILCGFNIGRLEFIWKCELPEAKKEFEPSIKEIEIMLASQDINIDFSSYEAFSNSILYHFLRTDKHIYAAICIGICITRANLIHVKKELQETFSDLAKSAISSVPSSIIPEKDKLFDYIVSNIKTKPLSEIIETASGYID